MLNALRVVALLLHDTPPPTDEIVPSQAHYSMVCHRCIAAPMASSSPMMLTHVSVELGCKHAVMVANGAVGDATIQTNQLNL